MDRSPCIEDVLPAGRSKRRRRSLCGAGEAERRSDREFRHALFDVRLRQQSSWRWPAGFLRRVFQVGVDDYVARLQGGGCDPNTAANKCIQGVWEKSQGDISNFNFDGSFKVNENPPWTSTPAVEITSFIATIGFGTSPDNGVPHVLAEFQLSIDDPANPGTGFYSPNPAFWSASGTVCGDFVNPFFGCAPIGNSAPISSAIFTLNPDGTTTVNPVFGTNGGPARQPQDVVPEPTTLILLGSGLVGVVARARRRRNWH